MRQTYRAVASLVALGVLVQAAAVAFGWFQAISDIDNGMVFDQSYEGNAGHMLHGIVGMYVIPALGLILLIVSFFAARTVPSARKWAAIVFVLILLQVTLAFVAFGAPIVGALHGINALLVLGTAVRASMLARTAGTATPAAPSAAGGVPAQRSASTTGTGADVPA
jgi:heme A synthase